MNSTTHVFKAYIIPYIGAFICTGAVTILIYALLINSSRLDIPLILKYLIAGFGIFLFVWSRGLIRKWLCKNVFVKFKIESTDDEFLGKSFRDGKNFVTIYSRNNSTSPTYNGYYVKNNVQHKCSCVYTKEFLEKKLTIQ